MMCSRLKISRLLVVGDQVQRSEAEERVGDEVGVHRGWIKASEQWFGAGVAWGKNVPYLEEYMMWYGQIG
jgi:hypothetical protein